MLAGVAFPAALSFIGWRGAMAAMAALILVYAIALEPLRRRLDPRVRSRRHAPTAPLGLSYVLRTPALRDLATASFAFHAMQVCLNTFLVAYLVGEHGYSLAMAGLLLAIAQFGGFVGRLGSGLIAGHRLNVATLLITLGYGMTAAALALGLLAGMLPFVALGVLCFLFGLTAAGWNGVFLAEVARHAPRGAIARVTGGVMMTAYAGLIFGPVVFSAAAAAATLAAGYMLLAATTLAGTVSLWHSRRGPLERH